MLACTAYERLAVALLQRVNLLTELASTLC